MPFEEYRSKADWDTSTLKRWLNDYFYNNAFNQSEKNKIVNYPGYDTVFLLSKKEIEFYSENILSLKYPMGDSYGNYWWLRDGCSGDYAGVCIGRYSSIRKASDPQNVRPAIWVDITKI